MKNKFVQFVFASVLAICVCSTPSLALRVPPNKAKIEAEAKQIQEMVATNYVDGLIDMLSSGEFPSKVGAAEHLGKIGDKSALPELERMNEEHGGWVLTEIHHDKSGAFAVAICKILTKYLPPGKQIEGLFDLLEGKGPAVPKTAEFTTMIVNGTSRKVKRNLGYNFDVGKRVAAELDEFDDSSIVSRLRKSINKGAAIPAVWMEVREMDTEGAIAQCVKIARDEGGAQRYGAIHCLGKFGEGFIDALDQLAIEGHREAITVLGYQKEKSKVFELLCWHLINNKNYFVRSEAVHAVSYVRLKEHRVESLKILVAALYDPSKNIRRNAARALKNRAYKQNKQYFDEIEDSLLIALKHPDVNVRENITTALTRLGCTRLDEEVPKPPEIRTDLEEFSKIPLTAEQRLEAKTEPLEKQAVKALKMGPAEEAIKLYKALLELRPDYEQYVKALKKAQAHQAAAVAAKEKWYPDAPYIGLKGRYSYLLASEPEDTSTLKEEFDLALFLHGDGFDDWSSIFGGDPKGKDQYFKALKLYEHIVEYYPENEYLVIRSKAAIGGLGYNLYRNAESKVLAYIDVFATPVEEVVDSTDHRRNKPLEEAGGKTQAQLDFERYYKDFIRARIIKMCCVAYNLERQSLLDEIIESCAETDPKIVEMAKAAKIKIKIQEQKMAEEAEREKAVGHHQ